MADIAMDELLASYDHDRRFFGAPDGNGECSDPDQWPAESTYEVDGVLAGRLFCARIFDDQQILYWIDQRFLVMGRAFSHSPPETLYDIWRRQLILTAP